MAALGATASPDRIEKTYHRRGERARPPQGVWRDAKVPRERLAEGARGAQPVLLRHALDRIGTVLEAMHGEEQPAPGDAIPGWGETGAPEPVLQRPPPDSANGGDLLHTERPVGMVEAEAEDWQQVRRHFRAQRVQDPLGDFGTRGW